MIEVSNSTKRHADDLLKSAIPRSNGSNFSEHNTVGLVVYQTSVVLERPYCTLGAMCFVTPAILCILSSVRNKALL